MQKEFEQHLDDLPDEDRIYLHSISYHQQIILHNDPQDHWNGFPR